LRFKKVLFILIIFMSGFLLFSQTIEIFYTSSLNGNLDGCDCKAVPRAGLVRTAPFIRQRDAAALFFDLGDSFDVYPDEKLHSAIQNAYISLDLDCAALGDQDFIEGVDWIKNSSYPYLAHNIKIDGKEISSRFKRFSAAGIEVAVGAVIDPGVFFFLRKR
jgi:2',3'-cyclic-nucleotide 2'-phosphodiesterase (5'-nucleotidase family)